MDRTPAQVFAAINNVRGWWSEEINGDTDKPGAEFAYRYKDAHSCTMKIVEFVPDTKVVWHVLDNYFSFTQDKSEWKDTRVRFDISRKGGQTEIHFTHEGLLPENECYEACSEGWSYYIQDSLKSLILTGKGQPNIGEAKTDTERALG
ncbi:MAG TPA: SRPBCC domain-containing protein [Rhodocyclaceae bacterium]|nr:SRPBCC domain-containing protein [Rhodocyclaceae bacterium]